MASERRIEPIIAIRPGSKPICAALQLSINNLPKTTSHKQLAKNNLAGFRARRNKRVSGSKFTFHIAEHAYHVQDLRTGGWANEGGVATANVGRAEGRGHGGAASRGDHAKPTGRDPAAADRRKAGGDGADGVNGADRADGENSSGGLHFACFEIGILLQMQLLCILTTCAGASLGTSHARFTVVARRVAALRGGERTTRTTHVTDSGVHEGD
jgi:hypothetical protein